MVYIVACGDCGTHATALANGRSARGVDDGDGAGACEHLDKRWEYEALILLPGWIKGDSAAPRLS